jgi:tetratricopeptide (TPR) repeat protein
MSAPHPSLFLPPQVEELLERFEAAWRSGTAPDLQTFLPAALPDGQPLTGSLRQGVLRELVKLDLEHRWRAAPVPAPSPAEVSLTQPTRPVPLLLEDYAASFPELGPTDRLPLALIGEEYRARQRWGDRPGQAEYLARFAGHGAALRELLSGLDAELAAERLGTAGPQAVSVQPPVPSIGRYRLDAPLGTGSFGTVWRAWDADLGRAVAVKLPRAGRFADSADEERFLREARSAARLRHPGIVAVHDVGRERDTVYLVSELVQGLSLEEWLTEARPGFAQAADLLARVAEALHHAHRHGVVHRDVKPSNIMLEVGDLSPRIMDFGLARWEAGEAPLTQEGQLLGTPAYMSPEQVLDPRAVDGRTDVYSLGVILYELLTGTLPFDGLTRMLLHQVLTEEPRAPRRLNDRIPRDLETIALTCLAKDPDRRYPSAQALADDLRRFRSGEPIRARPAPAWERAGKWARRRPALAALLAVSAVAVCTLLAGSLWYNARLQRALRETEHQRQRAERARDRAAEGFRQARRAVDEYFTRVSENRLLNREGLQPLRKELLEAALTYYREFVRQHGDDPTVRAELAATYLRVGWITSAIGSKEEALQAYRRARTLFRDLVEADPGHTRWQEELARVYGLLGALQRERGQPVEALRWAEQALALRKRLADAHPGASRFALAWAQSCRERGNVHLLTGRLDAALRDYEQARACFERWAGLTPSDPSCRSALAATQLSIGRVYEVNQQLTPALQAYEKGQTLFAGLARENPTDPEVQKGLAAVCARLGSFHEARSRRPEALRWHEKARAVQEQLLQANPSITEFRTALALSCFALGRLHGTAGRAPEARRCYERAHGLVSELVRANASVPLFQEQRAVSEHTLGQVLQQAGRPAEALRYYERARARLEELATAHPTAPDFSINLVHTYHLLGRLHAEARRSAEARRCHERACTLGEKLVRAYPGIPRCRHDLAVHHFFLAEQHHLAGERDLVRQRLEQARVLWEGLVKAHPSVPQFRASLAGAACLNLANWYREANQADKARRYLDQALRVQEELVGTNPDEPLFVGDLAMILLSAGNLQAQTGHPDEARGCAGRAQTLLNRVALLPTASVALRRQLGQGFRTLGLLQSRLGLRLEAVRSLTAARDVEEKLVRERPDSPLFLGNLADTCRELARLQQALGQPTPRPATGRPASTGTTGSD